MEDLTTQVEAVLAADGAQQRMAEGAKLSLDRAIEIARNARGGQWACGELATARAVRHGWSSE